LGIYPNFGTTVDRFEHPIRFEKDLRKKFDGVYTGDVTSSDAQGEVSQVGDGAHFLFVKVAVSVCGLEPAGEPHEFLPQQLTPRNVDDRPQGRELALDGRALARLLGEIADVREHRAVGGAPAAVLGADRELQLRDNNFLGRGVRDDGLC
jgi:hypothetical protein